MIALLLLMQLTVVDSTYSAPAVRELVGAAATANRVVPPGLKSYRAKVESEISFVLHPSDGPEVAAQVEQFENMVTWLRTGEFEQHVIGYRVRSAGLTLSSLSYVRSAWTVPVLYGSKLALFFGSRDTLADPVRRRDKRSQRQTPIFAIHPLSASRDAIYRFSGGDTVALIRLRNRSVAVRRVHVEPTLHPKRETTVFRGDIDIDADRMHIVRMRGRFVSVGATTSRGGRLVRGAMTPVAYVELVNAEVNEEFWLPVYQRVEAQVTSVMTGDARSVFRVVSRFHEYHINEVPLAIEVGSIADTLAVHPHRLTRAPADSLQRYSDWINDVGESAPEVRATDFDDLAPQQWKPTGPPHFQVKAERFSDVFRFNRVEGTYTGMGGALRMRDAFPGLAFRGHAGYAWSEKTLKGGVAADLERRRVLFGIVAARSLANTNDFSSAVDGGATVPALLGSRDDYDYVDRRATLASVRIPLGDPKAPSAISTISAGFASDRGEVRRLTKGVFGERYSFIQNRGIQEGRYRIASALIELHPEVTGEFVAPGVGALARFDAGSGALNWRRAEARLTARRNGGIFTYATRLDAGMLLQAKEYPPQQLFELGGTTGLPGYEYKEFAGDRAALGRGFLMASLPLFRVPIRVGRRWFLPAPSPALSFGLQAGWTDISNPAAAAAVAALGVRRDPATGAVRTDPSGSPIPLARVTGRLRTTADVGLRFFGGALTVGVARPLDHGDRWRFLLSGSTWQ